MQGIAPSKAQETLVRGGDRGYTRERKPQTVLEATQGGNHIHLCVEEYAVFRLLERYRRVSIKAPVEIRVRPSSHARVGVDPRAGTNLPAGDSWYRWLVAG